MPNPVTIDQATAFHTQAISNFQMTVGPRATLLVVLVSYDRAAGGALGLTWNGVAVPQVGADVGSTPRLGVFVLANPATGTRTMNLTTAPCPVGLTAVTFNDHTVTPSALLATNTGTGTGASTSGAVGNASILLDGVAVNNKTITVDPAQIQLGNISDPAGNIPREGTSWRQGKSGASLPMAWTWSGSTAWAQAIVEVPGATLVGEMVRGIAVTL